MKICSKTHQIALFKKFTKGSKPPNPPNKLVASYFAACNSPSPPKSWPPLAYPAYACGLLQRNLFEEMHS